MAHFSSPHIIRGQVSLESLLIWAALAGILGLLTPLFAQTMHAYELESQSFALSARAREVQSILDALAFEGMGSTSVHFFQSLPHVQIQANGNELQWQMDDSALHNPKIFSAHSAVPLEYIPQTTEEWHFIRTASGITIQ